MSWETLGPYAIHLSALPIYPDASILSMVEPLTDCKSRRLAVKMLLTSSSHLSPFSLLTCSISGHTQQQDT